MTKSVIWLQILAISNAVCTAINSLLLAIKVKCGHSRLRTAKTRTFDAMRSAQKTVVWKTIRCIMLGHKGPGQREIVRECMNSLDLFPGGTNAASEVAPRDNAAIDRGLGLIQMAYFRPVLSQLTQSGVPVERHLKRAGLLDFAMDQPEHYVPAHSVIGFLTHLAARELSNDPIGDLELGFRLANTAHYGRAVLSSPSLLGAAAQAGDPGNAVISYNTLDMRIDGPTVTIFDRYYHDRVLGEIILEGLSLMLLLDAMVLFGGPNCRPIGLGLTGENMPRHSLPVDLSRTVIRFGQPANSVTFPSVWLANAPRKLAQPPGSTQWAPANSVSARLRELFQSLYPEVLPTLHYIAEAGGMAPRTLQRRLAEEGTSFFEVLDTWRFETALQLLGQPRKRIGEIAAETGYGDMAHFIRAFRRWTGQTPVNYRENLTKI